MLSEQGVGVRIRQLNQAMKAHDMHVSETRLRVGTMPVGTMIVAKRGVRVLLEGDGKRSIRQLLGDYLMSGEDAEQVVRRLEDVIRVEEREG